jgi:Mrp family chromosome partitioning ATPase
LQLRRELPAVLAQLRDEADVVIIDGPPLLRDATATVLANMADGVMLVVDVRHDKLPLLLRSKELLGSLTRVPVGVTLNRASPRRRNAYFATVPARDSAPPQSHPRGPVPVGVATELLVPADLAVSTNHDGVSMGSEPR